MTRFFRFVRLGRLVIVVFLLEPHFSCLFFYLVKRLINITV